jgi:hypothetical protein
MMKLRSFPAKLLALSVCAVCALLFSATPPSSKQIPRPVKQGYSSDAERGDRVLLARPLAPYDTFVVAEFDFEHSSGYGPDPQGWFPVDLTAQSGTYFHVDNFNVPAGGGTQAIWCGARPDSVEPLCTYQALPGYGNDWEQMFTSVTFPRSGDVTLTYEINYDTEPGYDFVWVQYMDTTDNWVDLKYYEGQATDVLGSVMIPADVSPDSIKVRFYFHADGAYSDEDGKWDTAAGACQIDNIVLSDTAGVIDSQNFEAEAIDALVTLDGDWAAEIPTPFGDFASLYSGLMLKQEDPCFVNASYMWAFLDGSTTYGCASQGHENEFVIPFQNDDGLFFHAGIQSPVIDLTMDIHGTPVPADVDTTLLICDVYMDLPLDNLVFFYFASQNYPSAGGCPDNWVYSKFFWYEDIANWKQFDDENFFLPVNGEAARLRLLGIDNCPQWCSSIGSGQCHTKAPYIDNVKLVRIRATGPTWEVRPDQALLNDGFPADGTTTGTARMDMAANASQSGFTPRAGDSVVVSVWDAKHGLGMDATGTDPTRAAIYMYVRSSGGHTGPGIAGDEGLYVSDDGMWTRLLCDSAVGPYSFIVDHYACDLNDNLFLPGDHVEFYYSATNGIGETNFYSSQTGVVLDEGLVRANPDEAQCLPSGTSDVLLVDYFGNDETHTYFDQIFDQLGVITFDRFNGRAARSSGYSYPYIAQRTTGAQLAQMYSTIIWYGSSFGSLQEEEIDLLISFLEDQSLGVRDANLYLTGSNLIQSLRYNWHMKGKLGIDFNSVNLGYHTNYFDMNPLVTATAGSIFEHGSVPDEFYLHACKKGSLPQRFDVLTTANTGVGEMAYGSPPSATYFATISNAYVDTAITVKTVTDGFDALAIRDNEPGYPYDLVDHVADILAWFGHSVAQTDVATPLLQKNELAQNYPNPFNPSTTILFQIGEPGMVSIKIYDVAGRLIDTLINEEMSPSQGGHEVRWSGTDQFGNNVASGVYLYRLTTNSFQQTRKLVLLK